MDETRASHDPEDKVPEDYLTNLPNELLTEIISYLPEQERLKLRAVLPKPKEYEKFIVGLSGDKFNRLYVFTTHASLKRFSEICQTQFFQRHITEVVFVFKTLFDDLTEPATYEQYMKWYDTADGRTSTLTRWYSRLERTDDLHGEALGDTTIATTYGAYQSLMDEYCTTSLPKAETIAKGLAALPLLSTVSVSWGELLKSQGLNALNIWIDFPERWRIPLSATKDTAMAFLRRKHTTDYCPELSTMGKKIMDAGWMGAFVAALKKTQVQELNIGTTSVFPLAFDVCGDPTALVRMVELMSNEARSGTLTALKSLSLSCKDLASTSSSADQCSFWSLLEGTVRGIETLTIRLQHETGTHWHAKQRVQRVSTSMRISLRAVMSHLLTLEQVSDELLCHGRFPKLKTLKIIGQKVKPGLVQQPILHAFLLRHKETLQEVQLNGVLFVKDVGDVDVVKCIRTALVAVREEMESLQKFEMRVHRREDHTRWDECPCQKLPSQSRKCESYLIAKDRWMHRSHLEQLAEDLGVVLENGEWNFGEYY